MECEALVALYNSTDGPNWSDSSINNINNWDHSINNWNVTNTPCSWKDVTCEAGQVLSIQRFDMQLTGTIPPDLSWTDNSSDETGFKVERDGTLIATTAADATSYSDSGLPCGTTYSYSVKAFNVSGDSTAVTGSATLACPTSTPSTTCLTNISTRAIIEGGAGVDPTITIAKFPSGELVDSNDDWQDDWQQSNIPSEFSAPLAFTDTGLLRTLPAGAYTATLSSVGSMGLAIIEVQAIDE